MRREWALLVLVMWGCRSFGPREERRNVHRPLRRLDLIRGRGCRRGRRRRWYRIVGPGDRAVEQRDTCEDDRGEKPLSMRSHAGGLSKARAIDNQRLTGISPVVRLQKA